MYRRPRLGGLLNYYERVAGSSARLRNGTSRRRQGWLVAYIPVEACGTEGSCQNCRHSLQTGQNFRCYEWRLSELLTLLIHEPSC